MKKKVFAFMLALTLLVSSSGMITLAADTATVATIDGTAYTSLQAAVDAVYSKKKDGVIQLQKDSVEDILVESDVYIDLNGKDIPSVMVDSGTCFVFDSATSDFVSKSADDYGKIGSFTGTVQEAFPLEEDGCGYLMFSDNNKNASFHYVQLQITDLVLRLQNENEAANSSTNSNLVTTTNSSGPSTSMGTTEGGGSRDPDEEGDSPSQTPGEPISLSLYYKSAFSGDDVVAANVESFGVALSLVDEPSNIQLKQCGYTVLTDFKPGANANAPHSTLLSGIMKGSNTQAINKRNADMKVYGQAYLKLKNGSYVFGNPQNRTLKEQVQLINNRWTVLSDGEKNEIRTMYNRYSNIMQSWDLTALSEPYADVVEDAVTWYDEFVNLPIASADMTVEQLRQLTVDFFRLQQSFKWTPNTTFVYHDTEMQKPDRWSEEEFCDYTTLEPNVVYKGLPYCMSGAYHVIDGVDQVTEPDVNVGQSGSIYKAMNYYDPATGVLDVATIYEKGGAGAVYDVLTSNCTNGLTWGWNRISNSTAIYSTNHYTPANGALPVGYYVWNEAEMSYVDERTGEIRCVDDFVSKIIAAQGGSVKGRFRKAYAQLQPGDGLVTDGHVRMCTGVKVVYKEDGSIDPIQSKVWYIDMNADGSTDRWVVAGGIAADHTYRQDNGYLVRDLGGIREHLNDPNDPPGTAITFDELLKAEYIPVTIPEFSTVERIEKIRDQSRADFEAAGMLDLWQEKYAPRYQDMIEKMGIEAADLSATTGNLMTKTIITPPYFTQSYGGSIVSNYVISNIRIRIEDKNGNMLAEENPLISTRNRTKTLKLKDKVVPLSDLLSEETLAQYAGVHNRIRISVCLSTGQWVEVMNARINID